MTYRDASQNDRLVLSQALRGGPLKPCQKKAIINGALSIVIPQPAHQQVSPTYGQSLADAKKDAKDLAGSVKRDTEEMEKEVKKYNKECEKSYKEAAKKIRKITNRQYSAWLRKMLDSC